MLTVSAPLRAARAAVFAAVCVALSAAGHAFMTSEPLPWWTFAAGFAGVFAVAFAAAGRERSWAGIGVLLAAGQVALHTLFSFGMAAHADAAMDGRGSGLSVLDRLLCGSRDSGGHIMLPSGWSARDVVASAGIDPDKAGSLPAMPGGTHGGGHAVGPMIFDGGYGMLAAHAAAALVAAWWLRQGEAALFRLLARLHGAAPLRAVLAVLAGLFGTVPAAGVPLPVRRPRAAVRRLLSAELRHAVVRRGPPAFAPAC